MKYKKQKIFSFFAGVMILTFVLGFQLYQIKKINDAAADWRSSDYREISEVIRFGSSKENIFLKLKVAQKPWPLSLFEKKQRKLNNEIYRIEGSPYAFNQKYFVTSEMISSSDFEIIKKFNSKVYALKENTAEEIKTFSLLDSVKSHDSSYTAPYMYGLLEYKKMYM